MELDELVLSRGENGIILSEIKNKYKNSIDFKIANYIYLETKKRPFFFLNNRDNYTKMSKIKCLWEISREEFIGKYGLNFQFNEICSQVLRKIFLSGQNGSFQHTIGSELGLRTSDIHHHINNLIKAGLIIKRNFTIKTRSKLNYVIQLKCGIFEKKINENISYHNFVSSKDFEISCKLIKIISRIERPVKQKDIKYGILSYNYKSFIERRRIHRKWQKIKQLFLKAKISIMKTIECTFFDRKIKLLKKTPHRDKIQYKHRNLFNFKTQIDNFQIFLLFSIPPEIQIKKSMNFNEYNGITSPYLLEKFRGYINYKTLQTILKNSEEKRCLYKTLEQKGRQRIIRYKKDEENLNEYEKKIKFGVTDQVANRRFMLLSWVETQILLVRDLGRKIAQREKKGLKKVDSKVMRRLLSDLIEKGFLKIFKINIQILSRKPKNIEVIAKKNFDPNDFDFTSFLKKLCKESKKTREKQKINCLKKKINSPLLFFNSLFICKKNKYLIFLKKKKKGYILEKKTFYGFILTVSKINCYKKNASVLKFIARYLYKEAFYNFEIKNKILEKDNKDFISYEMKMKNIFALNIIDIFKIFYYTKTDNLVTGRKQRFKKRNSFKKYNSNINQIQKNYSKCFFLKNLSDNKVHEIKQHSKLSFFLKKNIFYSFNFSRKNIDYEKIFLPFFDSIGLERSPPIYNNLEKWDSELDVKLLEKHLNKKSKKNGNFDYPVKKNFIRRLKGILKVENIKLAVSYFEQFLDFSFSSVLSEKSYNPKNFLKRALEMSKTSFCLTLQKLINVKNFLQIKLAKSFCCNLEKSINFFRQGILSLLHFLTKREFKGLKSKGKLWKFNWLLFRNLNLDFFVDINIEEDNLFIQKALVNKNFSSVSKKNTSKFSILVFCQKISFLNFCSKLNYNLLNIIPIFINEVSKMNNNAEYVFKELNSFDKNISKKTFKPLEIKTRSLASSYKVNLKFLSKHTFSNFELKVKTSFFQKINNQQSGFKEHILNKYHYINFLIPRCIQKKFSKDQKRLYLRIYNYFLPWTSSIIYCMKNDKIIYNNSIFDEYSGNFCKNRDKRIYSEKEKTIFYIKNLCEVYSWNLQEDYKKYFENYFSRKSFCCRMVENWQIKTQKFYFEFKSLTTEIKFSGNLF